jgi:hypothetical protein
LVSVAKNSATAWAIVGPTPGTSPMVSTGAEAEPRGAPFPSCHFTAGMLSDFFTRLGGYPAAVMEVECRTRGEARCRFLVGSPDLLTWMYEGLTAGRAYEELLAELEASAG